MNSDNTLISSCLSFLSFETFFSNSEIMTTRPVLWQFSSTFAGNRLAAMRGFSLRPAQKVQAMTVTDAAFSVLIYLPNGGSWVWETKWNPWGEPGGLFGAKKESVSCIKKQQIIKDFANLTLVSLVNDCFSCQTCLKGVLISFPVVFAISDGFGEPPNIRERGSIFFYRFSVINCCLHLSSNSQHLSHPSLRLGQSVECQTPQPRDAWVAKKVSSKQDILTIRPRHKEKTALVGYGIHHFFHVETQSKTQSTNFSCVKLRTVLEIVRTRCFFAASGGQREGNDERGGWSMGEGGEAEGEARSEGELYNGESLQESDQIQI